MASFNQPMDALSIMGNVRSLPAPHLYNGRYCAFRFSGRRVKSQNFLQSFPKTSYLGRAYLTGAPNSFSCVTIRLTILLSSDSITRVILDFCSLEGSRNFVDAFLEFYEWYRPSRRRGRHRDEKNCSGEMGVSARQRRPLFFVGPREPV